MSNITLDNIKTWRDWGMVLMPCEDKKPLTKKGEWSVDWTEQELLNAKRVAVLHQPEKKGAGGKTFLTIDFDDPEFVASDFSSMFPASFTIGKKDTAGVVRTTHIEYEINPNDVPKKKVAYEKSIETLYSTCSIIGGVDRHTIRNIQPVRLSKSQIDHVLQLVKGVNFLQHVAKAFPPEGGRDESFLRLAGALAHTELSTELKENMIEKLCEVIGDNEVKKIRQPYS